MTDQTFLSEVDTMSQESLELLIADCFEQISQRDEQIASYWVTQLFDNKGDIKRHMITEATLQSLEKDVVAVYDYNFEE